MKTATPKKPAAKKSKRPDPEAARRTAAIWCLELLDYLEAVQQEVERPDSRLGLLMDDEQRNDLVCGPDQLWHKLSWARPKIGTRPPAELPGKEAVR